MSDIYLFEAGGTKTTLLISSKGEIQEINLTGYNPNRPSAFPEQFQKLNLPSGAKFFFYGAGLSSDSNKEIVRNLFKSKNCLDVEIYDDQVGAARALLGNEKGLVAIMGTGAFAGWFDGEKLIDKKGGHGYLIDDIGGGLELGKYIVSLWLNNDLNKEIEKSLTDFFKIRKEDFTTFYYQSPDPNLFNEIPKVISAHIENEKLNFQIIEYFKLFFGRHVESILVKHTSEKISICGSVAAHFKSQISAAALSSNLKVEKIISSPAKELLDFHTSKL